MHDKDAEFEKWLKEEEEKLRIAKVNQQQEKVKDLRAILASEEQIKQESNKFANEKS